MGNSCSNIQSKKPRKTNKSKKQKIVQHGIQDTHDSDNFEESGQKKVFVNVPSYKQVFKSFVSSK